MATFEFTCQKCEGNFEIDTQDLIDGSEELECPHCNARLTKSAAEDFNAAVGEFVAQLAAISKKFTATVEFDSEAASESEEDEDDDDDDDDDDVVDDDERHTPAAADEGDDDERLHQGHRPDGPERPSRAMSPGGAPAFVVRVRAPRRRA